MNGQPVTQEFEMGYDAENRVVSVTEVNGTNYSANFVYDGNGQRVKSTINSATTLFVGGYFEVANPGANQVITKYYPGGAMRKYTIPQNMNVEYALGDHLGSASIMTNSDGEMVSEMRYNPWGEVRYSWVEDELSTTPAYTLPKHTFTGQYSYMDDPSTQGVDGFGLMFYNARFYDPQVGRFAQADTIVPGGVQGLDRYAYINNNPVNGVDPSGHSSLDKRFDNYQKSPSSGHQGCSYMRNYNCSTPTNGEAAGAVIGAATAYKSMISGMLDELFAEEPECQWHPYICLRSRLESTYLITLEGDWSLDELLLLAAALQLMADFAGGVDNLNDIFHDALVANNMDRDTIVFYNTPGNDRPWGCSGESWACWDDSSGTVFISDYVFTSQFQYVFNKTFNVALGVQVTFAHEIGHIFADARPWVPGIYGSYVDDPFFAVQSTGNGVCDTNPQCLYEENMVTAISRYVIMGEIYGGGQTEFVLAIQHYWEAWP